MCLLLINFIGVKYHRDNLFHGDIKPENIFYHDIHNRFMSTSDVGSLLELGESNE